MCIQQKPYEAQIFCMNGFNLGAWKEMNCQNRQDFSPLSNFLGLVCCCLLACLFCFSSDGILLYISDWPSICYTAQAGFEFMAIPMPLILFSVGIIGLCYCILLDSQILMYILIIYFFFVFVHHPKKFSFCLFLCKYIPSFPTIMLLVTGQVSVLCFVIIHRKGFSVLLWKPYLSQMNSLCLVWN